MQQQAVAESAQCRAMATMDRTALWPESEQFDQFCFEGRIQSPQPPNVPQNGIGDLYA
jgi:hypothetical protein